jgi:hypothetical protein
MLASNPKNLAKLRRVKSCHEYFYDFQKYLRETLTSFEYQKLKNFPPPSSNLFLNCILDITHIFCWTLFIHCFSSQGLIQVMDDLIEEGKASVRQTKKEKKENIFKELAKDYVHVTRVLLNYPVGPLFKALDYLEQDEIHAFDNLMHNNLPSELFAFEIAKKQLSMIRMPSPTKQEYVKRVYIDDEFIGLLEAYQGKENKLHLIINLQNRITWKEHPRCQALENLQKKAELVENVSIVTLSKDSDFYHQIGPYADLNHAKSFKKQFLEHLIDENTGFYFPGWIKEQIFDSYSEKLMKEIHQFFFASKLNLSREERMDFIEIYYQFINLKLIELTEPTSFSLTCKDAIDSGASASFEFFSFLKVISESSFSQSDIERIYMLVFATPLIVRDRAMQNDRFSRMIHVLDRVQTQMNQNGKKRFDQSFGSFYKKGVLDVKFLRPTLEPYRKIIE